MLIKVEIGEDDLKRLVLEHLSSVVKADLDLKDVKIEVKSKQNYRSEWEVAAFRAIVEKS